jgi:hypothetical protein
MNIPPAAQCARWTDSLKNNTLFKYHHKLEEIKGEAAYIASLLALSTAFADLLPPR